MDGSRGSGRLVDARNRWLKIDYLAGSDDSPFSYHPDGALQTASRSGSTWTYAYNGLRLLRSETLSFEGRTHQFTHDYNTQGDRSALVYPSSTGIGTLSEDPNALGQPTTVGAYASGITYHPDGSLDQATLGTNIQMTRSLNTRQLPSQLRYLVSGAALVALSFAFDANANVQGVTDTRPGGLDTQSYVYDQLSPDPVGVDPITGGNFNRYWYGNNNPVTMVDPDGRIAGKLLKELAKRLFKGKPDAPPAKTAPTRRPGQKPDQDPPSPQQRVRETQKPQGNRSEPEHQDATKTETGGSQLSKEAQRGIRSLERRIAEHENKLAKFRENPTPRPGTEQLSEEIQQRSIEGRIRHLENETQTFRENIEKLRGGGQ